MSETTVGIFADGTSPLARRVAGEVWSGLSRAALDGGHDRISARWKDLREDDEPEGLPVRIVVLGQDRPDAVDATVATGALRLCGLVLAVPQRPSPLAGSLLYQGVENLVGTGLSVGVIEPALLRVSPAECERYARRFLARLTALQSA